MLLSNAFRPDPRVAREARTLTDAGHQVTILCWDRQTEFPALQTEDGYTIKRIQTVHTVYGAGMRQILHTPRFWRAAIAQTRTLQPDFIHCHDLDTLPAGWWLKRRTDATLIYDAHEDYPAMMSLYLLKPWVHLLSWLERRLLQRVDYTITASTVLEEKLRARGINLVTTIGNYQPLAPFDHIREEDIVTARTKLQIQPDDFVVAYIGGFSRNRQLLPLIETARLAQNVQILLWGDGHQRAAVEAAVQGLPNARYLGWLPPSEVPLYTFVADVIYYCLVPDYPGAIYNAPNTLSNAMAAGRPIIANNVGDLGQIIRKTGCGVLLDEVTPLSINAAIQQLRIPEFWQHTGEAGRCAARIHYNWDSMAQKLSGIYENLER